MFSSRDLSSPESRSMSAMMAVNSLVIEPILNPVSPVGGPLVGSGGIPPIQGVQGRKMKGNNDKRDGSLAPHTPSGKERDLVKNSFLLVPLVWLTTSGVLGKLSDSL